MQLSPREKDKLLLFTAALVAERRRARGVKLNYPALDFDREAARGYRLNIAAGTAVRFEPGQSRHVELVALAGRRRVVGFNAQVSGALDSPADSNARTP